jgi:hypothetical protein
MNLSLTAADVVDCCVDRRALHETRLTVLLLLFFHCRRYPRHVETGAASSDNAPPTPWQRIDRRGEMTTPHKCGTVQQ